MKILKEIPKRYPTNGTFELTVRCNLHCKMCLFRHDDSENDEIMSKELTTEQWIDMARQVADAGTMSLLITGGEPMLRKDFCEIWEGIYNQGFILELYTNATLITPKIMETLRKYPPHKIGITIYGASSETYGNVCGNANAFQKMINGVHELLSLPSTIEFRSTIIKDNYKDMHLIDDLVKKEFGSEYFVTLSAHVYKSVRGASSDVNLCRLSPKQMQELKVNRIINKAHRIIGDSFDPDLLKIFYNSEVANEDECKNTKYSLFGCKAGMNSYTVSWDGKLLACQLLGNFFVDIQQLGFATSWEKFPSIVRLPPLNPNCQKCDVSAFCYSCYASRYAETGRLNGCSLNMRQEAKVNKNYYQMNIKGE